MGIKASVIGFLLACTTFSCIAQDSSNAKFATIYFMRSSGAMGLNAFSAFIDDRLACHLNNNRYSIHTLSPGLHKFQVKADGKKAGKKIRTLDLTLSAGQKYYLMMDVTDHYFFGSVSLIELTENTAGKMLPKLKEDTNCRL